MANRERHLLLIEDEPNVGSTLSERLQSEGFAVTWVRSLAEALSALSSATELFDLALVDIGLPDGSGFDLAEHIRQKEPSTAVVFLTALGSPEDRVRGLELGAEDYIVKPFNFKELLLRINNALKRSESLRHQPDLSARIGQANVHFSRFTAEAGGVTTLLTHRECALLKYLFEHRGQTVSRDDILNTIWSQDEFPTPRTVDNFIVRLRRLVESEPNQPEIIRSVRGVGYQLL